MNTIILYNVILIIIFIMAFFAEKKNNRFFLILVISLSSLLVGLRSFNVGVDTPSYYSVIVSAFDTHPAFEAGFITIIRGIRIFYDSYTAVFLFFSFLTNGLIILRYWQLRKYVSFKYSVLFYYTITV